MEERYYKRIIEELLKLIDAGVHIVDNRGVGLFYNGAMTKIEEIAADEVVGKDFSEAFPEINLKDSTIYQAWRKGVSTLNKTQTYKNRYGKEVTTVNSTVPVTEDGMPIAAIEVAKDITNIKTMTDTILTLREKELEPHKVEPKIKKYTFEDLTGHSTQFEAAVTRGKTAAKTDASVFIYGETGTGKELMAQSIHYDSSRKNKPFLAQNCAALPETLLEGILFGTTKGGFTGAIDRPGLFEQANGGTLLLDEINSMPYELQSKLLRVLQEDYIRRVGGSKDIPIDVRIIATVNERPEKLIEEGKLRKDLYYRLNVVGIHIPPLREREGDIPILADVLLKKHATRFNKPLTKISEDAVKLLSDYDYPGNVRELENIIMQAVAMADDETELSSDLILMPSYGGSGEKKGVSWDGHTSLDEFLSGIEKELIEDVMREQKNNVSKAAEVLSLKRQTLQHKIKKYEISH